MNCRKHTFVTMVLAGLLGMPALWGEAASPKGKAPLPEAARTAAEGWSQKEAAKKGTAPVEGKTNQKNLSAPISNVPVKPPFKKAVREVELKLQRGQLISEAIGDVDGDGKEEVVDLLGNPVVEKSSFMGDLYIVVKEVGKKDVKYFIRPQNLGGYDPYLMLADVTGSGAPNVIVAAPTGGTSGMVDFRILDFTGKKPDEIFTAADNRGVQIVGTYLDGYRARLQFPNLPGKMQEVVVDLSRNEDAYHTLNVFDETGRVLPSGQRPYAQGISELIPMDTDGDGVDALITTQKVIGAVQAAPIGYVRTLWAYRAGTWQVQDVSFRTELYTKPAYQTSDRVKGKSGYEIIPLPLDTPVGNLYYPHFQKFDAKLAWKMNHAMEMFYRSKIRDASFGSRPHLSYDVKYAGKNYASILVMGLYSDHEMNEPIIQGFNFDLRTGEAVELKDLVRPAGKFWTMVRNEAQASGVSLTEKDVKGFYYDGAVLGLFYGDNREFDLEEDKVLPFMIKNRLEEEFLTSQSKEEKERNAEKKEERKVKTTESEI